MKVHLYSNSGYLGGFDWLGDEIIDADKLGDGLRLAAEMAVRVAILKEKKVQGFREPSSGRSFMVEVEQWTSS